MRNRSSLKSGLVILALSLVIILRGEALAATVESFVDGGPGTLNFGAYKEHMQGPVIFKDGGLLPDGNVIQQGEILAVLDRALILYPAGTDSDDVVAGSASGGVTIYDFVDKETITVTLVNKALVPIENVSVNADDSDRCVAAGGCPEPPELYELN